MFYFLFFQFASVRTVECRYRTTASTTTATSETATQIAPMSTEISNWPGSRMRTWYRPSGRTHKHSHAIFPKIFVTFVLKKSYYRFTVENIILTTNKAVPTLQKNYVNSIQGSALLTVENIISTYCPSLMVIRRLTTESSLVRIQIDSDFAGFICYTK